MRTNIIAGNWKMNSDNKETKQLVKGIAKSIKRKSLDNTRVILAPPFVNLTTAKKKSKKSVIEIAAQNMHQASHGAYTGEISASMLQSIEVHTVILGHSERRTYFGETDELLAEKVSAAIASGMEVIFCFGELLEDREADNHFNVVKDQLSKALFHLNEADWEKLILAYEPVWAIGTGKTASPDQAQEMHAFIRKIIGDNYSEGLAKNTSILYGGSVKPGNAEEIFSKEDVDGGLIGGASLKVEDFTAIVNAI